jgi:hypothetical protein
MIKTHIEFDETDVAKILEKIITGDNKKEMIKLLTPIICEDNNSVELLAKLFIGHSLPKLIPEGSFCHINYDNIGYMSQNKAQLYQDNCDENNMLVGMVGDYRGYHKDMYRVTFKLKDDNGNVTEDYCYIRSYNIEVIKEF